MMGIAQDVYEGDHENLNSLSRYLFNNVDCRRVWGKARGGEKTHMGLYVEEKKHKIK